MGESSPWLIGFAPARWTALTDRLRDLGYDDSTLLASGLSVRARTGRLIDRFRDRVMLAIRDRDGDTVAFIGRAHPGADGRSPRYLNSPTTPLYSKGIQLFGVFEAQAALDSGAVLVLTEGPLDAVAVHLACAGSHAPVALCGSAVTTAHADLVLQLTAAPDLILALDPDDPGRAAATTSYHLLRSRGLNPEHAALTDGSDPAATLVEGGREELARCIRAARPLAFALIDDAVSRYQHRLPWIEGRVTAARVAARVIAAAEPAARGALETHLARRTDLTIETVRREVCCCVEAMPRTLGAR